MSYQTDLRNKINDQIVDALSRGVTPWRKPWSPAKNTGYPANAVTGKLYRGVNSLLLGLAPFGSKWWATYRQWQGLGGQVRKGERGTRIIYWKPITKTRTNGNTVRNLKDFSAPPRVRRLQRRAVRWRGAVPGPVGRYQCRRGLRTCPAGDRRNRVGHPARSGQRSRLLFPAAGLHRPAPETAICRRAVRPGGVLFHRLP